MKTNKAGSVRIAMIARYDNSGLGTLSREFYRHLNPVKTLLVQNGKYATFPERFVTGQTRQGEMTDEDIAWLLEGVDVLISFETFYRWEVVREARIRGVKTVLIPMYECTRQPYPVKPDLVICPSEIDYDFAPDGIEKILLPSPINLEVLPYRPRLEAKTFVFNNGHGGGGGRNGLTEFLQAIALVKADVRFIIHSQVPITCNDRRVEVRYGNYQDYWDLFHEGDVFVFPHKFNGLSLPVQEAIGSGMPVLLPEFYPFTEWLPRKWMWDCKEVVRREAFKGVGVKIPFYESLPETIAAKIDAWANKDIERHSQRAREIAFERSWHVLKTEYLNVLAHLCNIS